MALASLTVDLSLGLAKFESDSGRASQIVVRDQEKMSRAALTMQRALERQADAATKTSTELQTLKAATLGLGDDSLTLIQRVGNAGGAFAAVGAQGTAAFKSIGVAAVAASVDTDKLLNLAVSKIREVNQQAQLLKSQAVSQNESKTLTDDGLKIRLQQINAVREATLQQINTEYTLDKQTAASAAIEVEATNRRVAAFEKLRTIVSQLNYKQSASDQQQQANAAKLVADAEEASVARRVAAFEKLRTTVAQLSYKQTASDQQQQAVTAKSVADAEEASVARRIAALEKLRTTVAQLNYKQSTADQQQQAVAAKAVADAEESSVARRVTAFEKLRATVAQLNYKQVAADQLQQAATAKTVADAEEAAVARRVAAFEKLRATVAQTNFQEAKAAQQKKDSAGQSFLGSVQQTASRFDAGGIEKTRAAILTEQAALHGLSAEAAPFIARIREADEANSKFGRTALASGKQIGLNTNQLLTLKYTISDVVASLGSGISPFTILTQQGGQLAQIEGGIGGILRGAASYITPFTVGIGAAALAVTGLGYAFYTGNRESKAFADSLTLTGNYAGVTEAQYNKLAKGIAASGEISISSAREFTQALIATGQIGPQALSLAAEAAARYGLATGKSAKDVAAQFASLNSDVYGGAKRLNETLNFLTLAQLQQIKAFEEQGRAADAQGIVYEALNSRLKALEPNLGSLDRTLRFVKTSWSSFWDAAYDIGRTETIDDKIAKADAALKKFSEKQKSKAQPGEGFTLAGSSEPPVGPKQAARIANDRDGLLREKQQQNQAAYLAGLAAQTAKEGTAAQEFVDVYLKRGKALDAYTKEVAKANVEFDRLARAGSPVSAANQAVVLKRIKEDFTDKPAQNEASAARKAQLDQDLKYLKDNLAQEQEVLQFGQSVLQAIYQTGTVSLKDFYAAKRAAIAAGVQAELDAVGDEQARLEVELAKGGFKDDAEKIRVQTMLNESREKGAKISRDASRTVVLANIEEGVSTKALNDRVTEFRASLQQLQGDELGAARTRATLAAQSLRQLATQSGGAITEEDLTRQARATALASDFAEIQRRTSIATADLARAEESFTLRATQNGTGLAEQEKGIYLIRSTALSQLGGLVDKAKELADASSDPRIKAAAADLVLQYQKAAEAVDPILTRMRDAGNEAGTAMADAFSNTFQKATTFKELLGGIYDNLIKIGTTKFIKEPLEKMLQGGIRSFVDGQSTTAKYAGTSTDPKAANYENSADQASSALSALTTTQTTLASATTTQTQVVTSSASALATFEVATQAAAQGLLKVAQSTGFDISKLSGLAGGNGYTIDYGGASTNYTGGSLPTAGGAASGTNRIPYDMTLRVHKNEAVLPAGVNPWSPTATMLAMGASPAAKYSSPEQKWQGGGGGGLNQQINVTNQAGEVVHASASKSNNGDIEVMVRKIVRDENGRDLSSGGGVISTGLKQRGVNLNGGLPRRD